MIDEIADRLAKHKLVPFFGAGVSAPQSGVLWRDLINGLADAISLPDDQRDDFLKVADEYVDKMGEPALADYLRKHLLISNFDDVKGWSHLFLISLNAGILYTTNQDNQFELASKNKGRPHKVIARIEDLATSIPSERLLIKYHGDLAFPETVIFSGRSYERRISDPRHFLNIRMQSDLIAKGFLFVGYSFNDPNIHLIFRELTAAFGSSLPPSYLIAYRYAPEMEELQKEFGVNIINPMAAIPDASSYQEAFTRYLSTISEKVIQQQIGEEVTTLLDASTPMAARVATEFDTAAVISEIERTDFQHGLKAFRSLDRTVIPKGLERGLLDAFKRLCDAARTEDNLTELAGAIFNLSLPVGEAVEAVSRFMVAINRCNFSRGFPTYIVACPAHPSSMIAVAAAMAVTEIRDAGDRVGEAFRIQADSWMIDYKKLPDNLKENVRAAMEHAWRDGGRQIPRDLFEKSGPFAVKSFDDIMEDMRGRLPRVPKSPRN